jgi:hypothetical protein
MVGFDVQYWAVGLGWTATRLNFRFGRRQFRQIIDRFWPSGGGPIPASGDLSPLTSHLCSSTSCPDLAHRPGARLVRSSERMRSRDKRLPA